MAYFNGRSYTNLRGLNLSEDNGALRFATPLVTPTTTTDERLIYVNSSNQLIFDNGSATTALGASGVVSSFSLNDAYDDGSVLTVDAGAVNFAGVHATNNTVEIAGAGSGHLIALTNTGSGSDILGTSSAWSVSAAGAAVFTAVTGCDTLTAAANLAINATGAGTIAIGNVSSGAVTITPALVAVASVTITGGADSEVFTITDGDAKLTNGILTLDSDDTTTGNLTIPSSTATSGNVVTIVADDLTSGAALFIDSDNGASFSGNGGFVHISDGTNPVLLVGRYGATTIAGNATGTASLTLTKGDFTLSDGATSLTNSGDAAVLTIVGDACTSTNVVDINADAITTGTLLHLDSSATGFNGKYIDCYDGAATEFSVGLDGATIITSTSAGTIPLTITHGGTTGDAMQIACSALTTGDALQIASTAETLAAGELLKITNTENGDASATPKTGNLCSITSSVTQTTASASFDYDTLLISRSNIMNQGTFTLTAAGSVLKLMNTSTNTAGTCTDSTKGLEIVMVDGGTAAPTGTAVDIISVGVGAKALNITSASTTVSDVLITGSGAKADNKAALEITSNAATAAGGSLLRVTNTGTPAAATSYLVDFDNSGATMTNNPVAVFIDGGGSTAAALQVNGSGAIAANSGLLELKSTATGAAGAVMLFSHRPSDNSEANADVIGRILFDGQDDANAVESYARIDARIKDVAAANPDGEMLFYTDVAGTLALKLELDADIAGVVVGSGAATAIVTSSGAYDLTLSTNSGTDSSVITITDAANGDIAITPNGTGQVQLTAPTYGQITAGADGAANLTLAMVGLYTIGNTVARTLTLPTMAGSAGAWYTIKKTSADAAAVTIDTPGAETIDGAATNTEVDAQYDSITIVSDGSNWHIVSKKIA